jgi:hypothetical protein
VIGWQADATLLAATGATVTTVGGCCGLAGNFGVEKGHYEVSVKVAEHDLLPAVAAHPDALVLADGFSCRTQLAQLANRKAITSRSSSLPRSWQKLNTIWAQRNSTWKSALAGEAAVRHPVRTSRLESKPSDLVGLVVGEVAFVPEPLRSSSSSPSHARMCVAIRSRNQRSCEMTTAQPGNSSKASSSDWSVSTSDHWSARRAAAGCHPSSASMRG